MALLPYLTKDIDDSQFIDMLVKELYDKLYPLILKEFRHRADCTLCHSTLLAAGVVPIVSPGTEELVKSPTSVTAQAKHSASDKTFNAEFTVAKKTSESQVK